MTDAAQLKSLCLAELSAAGLNGQQEPGDVIRFPAAHAQVGDLIVYFDGGEITVDVEHITHVHFTPYDADASNAAHRPHDCAREAAVYVAGVLSDRWVLWRYPNGAGGSYEIAAQNEETSDTPIDEGDVERFLWSGPISGPA